MIYTRSVAMGEKQSILDRPRAKKVARLGTPTPARRVARSAPEGIPDEELLSESLCLQSTRYNVGAREDPGGKPARRQAETAADIRAPRNCHHRGTRAVCRAESMPGLRHAG